MEILIIIAPITLAVIIGIVIYFAKFSYSKTIEEGRRLLAMNKIEEALKLFRDIVNRKPYDPNAHFYLAESHYQRGDFDWAMTEFKKVESFNKAEFKFFKEKILHERLADLYLRFGQTKEAQQSLLMILEVAPGDYDTHIKIGDIFFERGMFDNAISYYQKALSINGQGAKALFKCGEVFYYKKDFNQSLGYLRGALKHDSSLVKANYYIGMIYKATNNLAKAVVEFEIASQNKDVRVNSLFQKGIVLIKLGERVQAISSLERALKSATEEHQLQPKSLTLLAIRYNLASCYEDEKKILQALDQWEKIAEVNADYEDVKDKLKIYSDLRMDDRLKDFLTVQRTSFEAICRKIFAHYKQTIIEEIGENAPYFEALVSESEGEWIKARTSRKLVIFHRDNEPVSDQILRIELDKMKRFNASEVVIYSSSGFTASASEFSQNRPLKLIGREELSTILNEISYDKDNLN